MQIESLLILNNNNDILFNCHCVKPPRTWGQYLEKLVSLIPQNQDQNESILIYDDVSIAIKKIGNLKIITTAPPSSVLTTEKLFQVALTQFQKIISYCCNGEPSQEALTDRDNYIHLQMIIQNEISPSGFMRMIPETDFEECAHF